MASLDVNGLSHAFGSEAVLKDITFRIDQGAHMLLLGPSGSGKSTLINLITGILPCQSGTIHVAGEAMSGARGRQRDDLRRRRIGVVFQSLRLVSALTVRRNLHLAQRLATGTSVPEQIDALLDRLGIRHRADAPLRQLSQGQLQRAAIARALIGRPALLVADEPTSALDDANAADTIDLLLETAQAQGTSLLVATHDRRIMDRIGHRLILGEDARAAA
ncbi:MAG: ATP-binding cassette domain-containing protein [Novosphingobium sp.]|uniref:ABC transporter ATP-binding protein n=1 Tax=Novosphingobium sp. TaxID=1874826 RepID=UPI0027348443|nr:ATP-binding cassette domain-containing protein [Novosphingobium sp.]MDP3550396.1 ATP-binding cassette domain-containing protein [Novosphingobium sp.]